MRRLVILAACSILAQASFEIDVVRRAASGRAMKIRQLPPSLKDTMNVDPLSHPDLNAELLAKAIPLSEYEQRKGYRHGASNSQRLLNQQEKYNFEVDYEDMYSFSGFSLKYAKCQPVQYFSEDAILAGEHSPMVTEDIVVLRLCPQSTCSSSSTYGCYYNFADYALSLGEYIGIMLRYSARVRENTCEWCDQCLKNEQRRDRHRGRRRLEDAQQADAAEGDAADEGDAAAEGDGANNNAEAAADDALDDLETDDFDPSEYACDGYNDYCTNYNTMCKEDGDDDTFIDYENFVDYMDCTEVKYNDYAYFVRPRCDVDSGTIKMAVYYDNYCIQYAGNDINVKNFGLGFKEGMFSEFYSSTCIECSDSEGNPPYFGSNSILCNLIHELSAKCTQDMLYDLFEKEEDESSECSFIESIRFGVYDKDGAFAATSSATASGRGEVSIGQLVALLVALVFCVLFIIYACYLHHSMTNLLIKSLSHRELLPPSRHKGSRTPSKSSSRRSGGASSKKLGGKQGTEDEPDWDSAGGDHRGEMA